MNNGFTPLQQAVANADDDFLTEYINETRPDLKPEWDFLNTVRNRAIAEKKLISDFLPYDEYTNRRDAVLRSILENARI